MRTWNMHTWIMRTRMDTSRMFNHAGKDIVSHSRIGLISMSLNILDPKCSKSTETWPSKLLNLQTYRP